METMEKVYRSDNKGCSFLTLIITVAAAVVTGLLRYLLDKLEIMFPHLFEQERALPEIIIYSIIAALAAAYIIFAVIILRLWHRSLRYTLTGSEVISDSGVIVRTRQIMKYSSVQYVTKVSLPLSSVNSFNFIIISALGGRMVMMFLSDSDAAEAAELLSEMTKESADEIQQDKNVPRQT